MIHEPCQAAGFPKDALSLPWHWHVSWHVVATLSMRSSQQLRIFNRRNPNGQHQDLHGRQNICRCCISEMSGQHRPWQKPRRCKTNSLLTDRNGRRRKQCRSWGSAFVPGPPKTQRLKTNVLQLLSIDPSFWDAFRCQSDGSWSYTKCLRPQALFGWISRFPTQTTV